MTLGASQRPNDTWCFTTSSHHLHTAQARLARACTLLKHKLAHYTSKACTSLHTAQACTLHKQGSTYKSHITVHQITSAHIPVLPLRRMEVVCTFGLPSKVAAVSMSHVATSHCLIATACHEPLLRLCDPSSGAFTHTLVGHRWMCVCVCVMHTICMSAGYDTCVTTHVNGLSVECRIIRHVLATF